MRCRSFAMARASAIISAASRSWSAAVLFPDTEPGLEVLRPELQFEVPAHPAAIRRWPAHLSAPEVGQRLQVLAPLWDVRIKNRLEVRFESHAGIEPLDQTGNPWATAEPLKKRCRTLRRRWIWWRCGEFAPPRMFDRSWHQLLDAQYIERSRSFRCLRTRFIDQSKSF
jgi:hypothetical protein